MRIFFSTLSASALADVVHSLGSRVRPYLANRARALSCWLLVLVRALGPSRTFVVIPLGLMSRMDCWIAAGTEGVGPGWAGVSSIAGGLRSCQ